MRCFVCGKGVIKRETATVEATVRGERYRVQTPALVCKKCGHVAVEGEDAPEYMRRGADAYRKAHRLLTSSEIQERRHALKMNQRQFAAYLKVGEASLKRWELGQIQDAAMNELIVLRTDLAAAQRNLTELGFRLAATAVPGFETGYGQFEIPHHALVQFSRPRPTETEPEGPRPKLALVGAA